MSLRGIEIERIDHGLRTTATLNCKFAQLYPTDHHRQDNADRAEKSQFPL